MKDINWGELKEEYDVIVVGAGPAGSTFSRIIDSTDLSVLVIDGQTPSKKKPCGGLLAPDAQKLMAGFDFTLPKDVLVDPQIFSVKTMDLLSGITRSYQRYYLNMDRYKFDKLLQNLVPDSVEHVSAVVTKVERIDEQVERVVQIDDNLENRFTNDALGSRFIIELKSEGAVKNVRCKFIVGADGASSIVRRTFYKKPILKYIAIQQWFRYEDPGDLYYSCIFDPKTSESCSWLIRKNGYIIFGGCFDKKKGREAFEEQKKRLMGFTGLKLDNPEFTEACLACRPRHMRDFVTGEDGAYLIGEAAGFISASSLEGISFAIRSGKLLAEAFIDIMHNNHHNIEELYKRKTRKLRIKLMTKVIKHDILFTPVLRKLIMASGIQSIHKI